MAQLYNVQLVVNDTAVDGPIHKVICLGYTNTVAELTYGQWVRGGDNKVTSVIDADILTPAGTVITGPLTHFKSANSDGKFLVYLNSEY
tara:strand:- start:49 stop:315 length:267 start_codon:yes stop_codon:yes gene_type:complete